MEGKLMAKISDIFDSIKNNNGLLEDFQGNTVGGKILQVVYNTPTVPQTNIATTDEVYIDEMQFTLNKKKSDSIVVGFIQTYNYYSTSCSYWWMKAYANDSLVISSGWRDSIITHNSTQYTYNQSAHQLHNGHFIDNTNADSITYKYSFTQNEAKDSFVIWGVEHLFIYMEVANV
jgi:hypothetical protein